MTHFFFESCTAWIGLFILAAYHIASKKTKILPNLPLLLLILFFASRIVLVACRTWGWLVPMQYAMDVGTMVLLSWAVSRLVFAFAVEFPLRLKNKSLPKISRDSALAMIFAVLGAVTIVFYGDFNPTGVVTTSAVATAVLGFGAQGILSSFFSGIVLQMQKPFEVGDWIQVGEFVGRVSSISWKMTRMMTRDNETVCMPNQDLLGSRILNFTKPDGIHRASFMVGLQYEAAPNTVRATVLEIVKRHPHVLPHPEAEVRLTNFGDFSIDYRVIFYTREIGDEPAMIAAMRNELWYAFRRMGIQIPFPIRDVRVAHEERRHDESLAREKTAQLESLLGTIPILAPLSPEERAHLATEVRLLTYGNGETIVQEGNDGDSMYIIKRGACGVSKVVAGAELHLTTLPVGAYFGEMSLLTGEKRSATVKAAGDTEVIVIDKQLFSHLLLGKPEISAGLADALAERQHALQSHATTQQEPSTLRSSLRNRIMTYFGLK